MTSFADPSTGSRPVSPSDLGLDPGLAACGLNVAGLLTRDVYDARVPDAWQSRRLLPATVSVCVIGSGGSAFYRAARAARPDCEHPLDELCEARLVQAVEGLRAEGFESRALFYWEKRAVRPGAQPAFADFVDLARAAGLGLPSRIGLLLHPHFGPWFAIRALLLTARPLTAPPLARPIDFCASCDAPCRSACPGQAIGDSGYDVERCSTTRHRLEACASRCAARLACPVGRAHVYDDEALAHHMQSHFRES